MRRRLRRWLDHRRGIYRTATGRVLTDADIEALADEAERGYDVSELVAREGYPKPPPPKREEV